ncbi:MAG: (cytosine-5)-methyltransferase 1 [Blastocatellia bacterium]|jgi:DNA (cytosine-5)-methyltransferase 1|nr:(cytosine-5)-methyltransferase 1 [Blastocatellia bacterium]
MPDVIDLYAGAGGLSLGAARANFRVVAAVENDRHALDTHTRNFPQTIHVDTDAAALNGDRLLEIAGLRRGQLDGIIGGPPCQGFSFIGQKRLDDDRNNQFGEFFRLVGEVRPKFFLAENVPGILDVRFDALRERAMSFVSGYEILNPIKVVASDYGAPTTRTRIFFVGFQSRYFEPLTEGSFAPRANMTAVCVREALRGLPTDINPEWQSERQSWRSVSYNGRSYFTERSRGRIPANVGDPDSLERHGVRGQVSGCLGTRHSADVAARYGALEPGEQDIVSKSVKLAGNGLCPTLRAGTGRDRGSYQAVRPIHYLRPRVITPREGGRLQGFPDWFVFQPTKWHSFRQIGNSVSPIVAERLLQVIANNLRR